uniref:Galactose/methyl galactoside ABC transport system protein n=1 Tax=uncultured bacterium contig00076 TaxID=1181554 RepID=A0A806K212_9BACT|nr:galactose/methyl galactoside ABC transport system protein [uncultured bacterium contig00076]
MKAKHFYGVAVFVLVLFTALALTACPPPDNGPGDPLSTTYRWLDGNGNQYELLITQGNLPPRTSEVRAGKYRLTITLTGGDILISEGTASSGSGNNIVFTPNNQEGTPMTFTITIVISGTGDIESITATDEIKNIPFVDDSGNPVADTSALEPAATLIVVNIKAIAGVTVPAAGKTPATAITETAQYTGIVTWNDSPSIFAAGTEYTATIVLTAKDGFTFNSLEANYFTVAGATTVTSPAGNDTIITVIAKFPATVQMIKVDVFWYSYADYFLDTIRNAMETQCESLPQLSVTHHDAYNDQATQIMQIQEAIDGGSQLLIVNMVNPWANDGEYAQTVVGMAKEADIPVIFFNREISNAIIQSYAEACFIGNDAKEAGYRQGEAIANFLLKQENWIDNRSKYDLDNNNQIKYIMFKGIGDEANWRTLYSVQEANRILTASGKSLRLVPSSANDIDDATDGHGDYDNDGISRYFLFTDWDVDTAKSLMSTALGTYSLDNGDIELIISNFDGAALGVIEVMNGQGFNTEDDPSKYIPVFGIDVTDPAKHAIDSDTMTASVYIAPQSFADTILALAQNVANGENVFANTGSYNVDAGVKKLRVRYSIYPDSF